jgi:hypothetical protein
MAGGMGGVAMELKAAQSAMRNAHVGGAPGVFVSGIVWIIAGLVWLRLDVPHAFTVLFFGGMAIVPLAILIARVILRAPKPLGKNPLDRLALESTMFLFAGLLIAYALLRLNPAAVFPIMAVTIGARYFTFGTIYGEAVYWVVGGALIAVGSSALLGFIAWPLNVAVVAGFLEVGFAAFLLIRRDKSEG